MGRLIDADKALELYNENTQITIDKAHMPKFLWESIVRQASVEAIPIPKGATNGDIIKALFPEVFVTNCKCVDKVGYFNFDADWWNAPYKGEQR